MSKLLSKFCAVQALSWLGNLSALRNVGVSAFRGFICTQTYVNPFGTKWSVHNIYMVAFQRSPQAGIPLYQVFFTKRYRLAFNHFRVDWQLKLTFDWQHIIMESLSEMLIIAVTMSTCNAYTLFQNQAVWHLLQHLDNNSDKVFLIKLKQLVQVFYDKYPPYGTLYK